MKKYLLLLVISCALLSAKSQNLILNSDMNAGSTNWDGGGTCTPEIGCINCTSGFFLFEDTYGGPSTTNIISQVSPTSCMTQTIPVTAGQNYIINFKATRRTTCGYGGGFGDLDINPGINVKVTGVQSNTVYSSADYHYSNQFWVGYSSEIQSLLVAGGSGDTQVRLDITAIDNTSTGCGLIIDDITMIQGTLPINLTGFNAAAKGNTVDLSWTTSNEVNSAYYIVSRSKDGINFTEVGKVAAVGSASTYVLNDAQAGSGISYYRLKMVDQNGIFRYSGVIRVNLGVKDLDVHVYPTIVNDVLNYVIENPKATRLAVMVTDLSGKRVSSTTENFANGSTQKSINVANLASGVYFLTIADEGNGFKKSVLFKKN